MGRNYTELRKKIRSKYLVMSKFAADLGITVGTLNSKLKGITDWKREEIEKAASLLDLTTDEVIAYFFN